MTQEEFELTRKFLRKYVAALRGDDAARLGYAIDDRFYGLAARPPRAIPQA